MTPTWIDALQNPEQLLALFREPPADEALRLHSFHLNRRGPAMTLRLSTLRFVDVPPADWRAEEGLDVFEFQLRFLDVAEVAIAGERLPVECRISLAGRPENRFAVLVEGPGVRLGFSANRELAIGHLNAHASAAGPYGTSRRHLGKVDAIRYPQTPDTWEKTYYERL
ncbi:hypothetical protein AKJ09_08972 [Labilithrix luteola]|uniref:Uncharacterized protein n=1 Tax=Labilithrix luteola TaxID=1391654 RepID=A0A0K1Q999_9BACT|nr:Imm50 family immunity protein [Labilithrix luteola]AKV02309.1 hypothetical protein AKJ09_08972 [Labilithrix luteola]